MTKKLKTIFALLFCLALHSTNAAGQDKYAVLIGVESYDPSVLSTLEYAEDDAIALCRSLTHLGFKTKVMTGQSKVSTGKPNSPEKILTVLRTQMNNCAPGDTMVISLSGHGLQFSSEKPDENNIRETYFCPEDADPNNKSSLLPVSSIVTLLKQCPASRKLLLIDACRNDFANTAGQKKAAKKLRLTSVHETRRSVPSGMNVLFSCDQEQFSFEDDDLKHSVFSHFVIKYLNGNAGTRYYDNNQLSLDNLIRYVRKRTNEYVSDNNLAAEGQTPVSVGMGTDWILGAGVNPVLQVLNRHIQWLGGLENLRKIRTYSSDNRLTYTLPNRTYNYDQKFRFRGNTLLSKNYLDGNFSDESGANFKVAWNQAGGVLTPDKSPKIQWLSNHPLAILKLLELVPKLEHSKRSAGEEVVKFSNQSGNYVEWIFSSDGSLKNLVTFRDGAPSTATYSGYTTRQGVKFWTNANHVYTFDGNPATALDQITNLTINSPVEEISIPASAALQTTKFDVDLMIEDFKMYKQENVQSSDGFLSDIQFRKINSSTVGIDYSITPGGYFIQSIDEMKTDLRNGYKGAIDAGLKFQIRYFSSTGSVLRNFMVSAQDR